MNFIKQPELKYVDVGVALPDIGLMCRLQDDQGNVMHGWWNGRVWNIPTGNTGNRVIAWALPERVVPRTNYIDHIGD